MYVILSKNGAMVNVDVNPKTELIRVLVHKDTCGIPYI